MNLPENNKKIFFELASKYKLSSNLEKYKQTKKNANENATYAPIRWLLQLNCVENKTIEQSNFIKYLKNILINNESIYICKLQSPSHKDMWDKIAIRGEVNGGKFLCDASNNVLSYAVSAINIDNKILYILVANKFWFGYQKFKKGNNHPITFTFADLERFKNISPYIQDYITYKKKNYKYSFLTIWANNDDTNNDDINNDDINNDDINNDAVLSKQIKEYVDYIQNYNPCNLNTNNKKNRKIIPEKIRNIVAHKYHNRCILDYNNQCKSCIDDWNKTIKFVEKYNVSYVDYHHLLPINYWFKDNYVGFINWNAIHDERNLIQICEVDHMILHNKSDEIKKDLLQTIFKNNELYEEFLKYLNSIIDDKQKFCNKNDVIAFLLKYY